MRVAQNQTDLRTNDYFKKICLPFKQWIFR